MQLIKFYYKILLLCLFLPSDCTRKKGNRTDKAQQSHGISRALIKLIWYQNNIIRYHCFVDFTNQLSCCSFPLGLLSHSNNMHNITYHEHIAKKYNPIKTSQASVSNPLKKVPSQTSISEESNVEFEAREQNTQVIVLFTPIWCNLLSMIRKTCTHHLPQTLPRLIMALGWHGLTKLIERSFERQLLRNLYIWLRNSCAYEIMLILIKLRRLSARRWFNIQEQLRTQIYLLFYYRLYLGLMNCLVENSYSGLLTS